MGKSDHGILNIGGLRNSDDKWGHYHNPDVDDFPSLVGRMLKDVYMNENILDQDAHSTRIGKIVQIHPVDYFDPRNSISKMMPMDTDIRELGLGTGIAYFPELNSSDLIPDDFTYDHRKPTMADKYKKRLLVFVAKREELSSLQIGQLAQFTNKNLMFQKIILKARLSTFMGKSNAPVSSGGSAKTSNSSSFQNLPAIKNVPQIIGNTKKQVLGWRNGFPNHVQVVKVLNYPGRSPVWLHVDVANAFMHMRTAAAKEGVKLQILTGYRDIENQKKIYACYKLNQKCRRKGKRICEGLNAKDYFFDPKSSRKIRKTMTSTKFGSAVPNSFKCPDPITKVSAPGWSEHNWGGAVDMEIGYASVAELQKRYSSLTREQLEVQRLKEGRGTAFGWLSLHADKFGFVVEKDKSWHYNYIGKVNI